MDRRRGREARLAALAADQHGVVARFQLRTAGFSDTAIARAVAAGRLHPLFRGTYAVGYPVRNDRARMKAATLACGTGAVISHMSAAALLGLIDRAPAAVDVIAPGGRGRQIDGIRVHDVPRPVWEETGTVDGIPCTSPARTLVDLAGTVGLPRQRSCFERAAARGMLDLAAVEAAARRARGRRGTPTLWTLIAQWRPAGPALKQRRLKSALEAMVLPILGRRQAPTPLSNAPVELADGTVIEVDFLWPEQRFVLEADSRDFHATDAAFERDRWRDRELMRVGYSTLRVTREQCEREAEKIADAIAARLGLD